MRKIKNEHLDFLQEARISFENNPRFETYRNEEDSMIALRWGADRDCILIYELNIPVANFVQQLRPNRYPRKSIMIFSYDMEKQLKVNDHKGGWKKEHWSDLVMSLQINSEKLKTELMKKGTIDFDPYEVTIRASNVANYAMMIAENEGEML